MLKSTLKLKAGLGSIRQTKKKDKKILLRRRVLDGIQQSAGDPKFTSRSIRFHASKILLCHRRISDILLCMPGTSY